jgi:hypothetical protein
VDTHKIPFDVLSPGWHLPNGGFVANYVNAKDAAIFIDEIVTSFSSVMSLHAKTGYLSPPPDDPELTPAQNLELHYQYQAQVAVGLGLNIEVFELIT